MVRMWSVLPIAVLMALVMAFGGCRKALDLPSYDIKIEREQEQSNAAPQSDAPAATPKATTKSY